jgi:hypothetical protein
MSAQYIFSSSSLTLRTIDKLECLGLTTLSITTFILKTNEILKSDIQHNDTQHISSRYRMLLSWVSQIRTSCWVSLCWVPLCWMSLCWKSFCWASLRWVPLCWVSMLYCLQETWLLSVALILIGLQHRLDGVTNPKYKLLHFLTTIIFTKRRTH